MSDEPAIDLSALPTEDRNPRSARIDQASTREMLEIIHEEDRRAVAAVGDELPSIARALDRIHERYRRGGRLLYIGAGTSGRLGALDAAELPPTYGIDPERAVAILAGGPGAMFRAVEGAEDDRDAGARELDERGCSELDSVIGLAAGGRTPFVLGAVERARARGALTVAVTSNPDSELAAAVDVAIAVRTGPEVVAGSTRMKSGSAQKLVLNMLSTGLMIRMGYVYGNRMVNVRPSNAKLRARARRLAEELTGSGSVEAARAVEQAGDVRLAALMLRYDLPIEKARATLDAAGGNLRKAFQAVEHPTAPSGGESKTRYGRRGAQPIP